MPHPCTPRLARPKATLILFYRKSVVMGPVQELSNVRKTKFAEYGFAPLKKQINEGFTEGALMTSQLCHYFQASQAVHGADDITTPHF